MSVTVYFIIVSSKFVVIGSANCGDRSLTHDSEVVAGIYDPAVEEPSGSYTPFAKKLRQRLWAHHLGMAERDVANVDVALSHWSTAPFLSQVSVKPIPKDDLSNDDDNLIHNAKGAVGAATGQVDPRGDCSS